MFYINVDEDLRISLFDYKEKEKMEQLYQKIIENKNVLEKVFKNNIESKIDITEMERQAFNNTLKYIDGSGIECVVEYKKEVIGRIWSKNMNNLENGAQIDFWIDEKYKRQGIMTKVVKKFIKKLFEADYNFVLVDISIDNESAKNLLEKLNFKIENETNTRKIYRKNRKIN